MPCAIFHCRSPTDCTNPAYNQGPGEDVTTLREMLNVAEIGFEDNFQGVYFCVDRTLEFKVLSELFDGVAATNSRKVGTWPTGQNKWSSYPSLKVTLGSCNDCCDGQTPTQSNKHTLTSWLLACYLARFQAVLPDISVGHASSL